MKYLVAVVAACGSDPSGPSETTVDATADVTAAAFCDGTPHDVGQGILNGLTVDASGRLLAVGTEVQPAQRMVVKRFLATGEVDASFGDASFAGADGHAVAVRADGSIVAGGMSQDKPFAIGFTEAGTATGLSVNDTASPDSSLDWLAPQGTAVIAATRNSLRRITDGYDATFTTVNPPGPAAVSASGLVIATRQIDSVITYRLTPDGAMVANSSATVATPDIFTMIATTSHADAIAFVGATSNQHLLVGRVAADNTPGTYADLGALQARAAFERSDGSLLLAAEAKGIVVVKPDNTIDTQHALKADPTKYSLTAVTDWNGHPTGAGTLAGGRMFVVCF